MEHSSIIEYIYKVLVELNDPVEIMQVVASTARSMRKEFGDIVILMLATAPHDKHVSNALTVATARYRQAIRVVLQHLAKLDTLAEGVGEEHAIDVMGFCFGYWGLYSLHVESGWDCHRAEKWHQGEWDLNDIHQSEMPSLSHGFRTAGSFRRGDTEPRRRRTRVVV